MIPDDQYTPAGSLLKHKNSPQAQRGSLLHGVTFLRRFFSNTNKQNQPLQLGEGWRQKSHRGKGATDWFSV
jgi:hypothetical protein